MSQKTNAHEMILKAFKGQSPNPESHLTDNGTNGKTYRGYVSSISFLYNSEWAKLQRELEINRFKRNYDEVESIKKEMEKITREQEFEFVLLKAIPHLNGTVPHVDEDGKKTYINMDNVDRFYIPEYITKGDLVKIDIVKEDKTDNGDEVTIIDITLTSCILEVMAAKELWKGNVIPKRAQLTDIASVDKMAIGKLVDSHERGKRMRRINYGI